MPTNLLDWVRENRRSLVRGTWLTAFLAIGLIGVVTSKKEDVSPAQAAVVSCFLALLYFGQHWLFVRRGRRDRAGARPATLWNLVAPVAVFTLQGCLTSYYLGVALLHLTATPDFVFEVQQAWHWQYALVPAAFAAWALYSTRALQREQALHHLASLQLLLGWSSVVLVFAAFFGMANAGPYYLQQYGDAAQQMPAALAMLLLHPCFALGVFASVQKSCEAERGAASSPRVRPDQDALPADGYLSSARALSFVLIVFTLLAFDVARSNAARVSLLREARDMFARQTARDLVATLPDLRIADMPSKSDWIEVGEAIDFPTYGEAVVKTRVTATPEEPGKTGFDALYSVVGGLQVIFDVDGGRTWRSVYNEPRRNVRGDDDPRERVEFSDALPQDFARILRRVGLPVDSGIQREGEYYIDLESFAAVEESLLRQPVSIPSLGLGVESNEAIWILAGAVVVLLVLLRSRVDACLARSSSGIAQPWLILDARSGVESVAAGSWLLAIGLSAWVANGSLVALIVSEKYAQGAASTPPAALAATATILALFALGGWLSMDCVSRLLRLRDLRRAQTLEGVRAVD